MLRANRLLSLLLLGIGIATSAPQIFAQALSPPFTGIWKWDATNQVLFFGYGTEEPGLGFVVRGYADARQRGEDINIFKDFPGAQEVIVDGLTAGPGGTTLIAASLNADAKVQDAILTYDPLGGLLGAWDPAPQEPRAIAYSKEDDALFVLGGLSVPNGANASDQPLVVEYSLDGRTLRSMVPASTLKDGADSLFLGGDGGEPALKVTRDRIYFYAPENHEAVICDHNGRVIAYRNVSDIVGKISTQDGSHLVQIHGADFTDDGELVLELALSNERGLAFDVFRINIATGEAAPVRKAYSGEEGRFIGVKGGQYLYLANSPNPSLVESQESR
jgi:hypothetical protein